MRPDAREDQNHYAWHRTVLTHADDLEVGSKWRIGPTGPLRMVSRDATNQEGVGLSWVDVTSRPGGEVRGF